jgi:hypothetical protein
MSMTSEIHGLPYEGQDEYEFEHRNGNTISVRVSERKNGSRVRAYRYGENGEKMGYHAFRINNADDGRLVMEDEKDVPSDVASAIHAGGWWFGNASAADLPAEPIDPFPIMLLNARDTFQDVAREANSEFLEAFYETYARLMAEAVVVDVSYRSVAEQGEDIDDIVEQSMNPIDQAKNEAMSPAEKAEGIAMSAIRPENKRSDDQFERVIDVMERARLAYEEGADWEEAQRIGEEYAKEVGR